MAVDLENFVAAVSIGVGVHFLMRQEERTRGHVVVFPGTVDWLPLSDWHETVVVARDRRYVRLIAMLALHPGHGALTRTISGIAKQGMIPVLVEPSERLVTTLTRWNWKRRHSGAGIDREELWTPRRGAIFGGEG